MLSNIKIKKRRGSMATHAIFSTLGRPRKESQELKARLGYRDLISQQQGAQLSQGAGLGGEG